MNPPSEAPAPMRRVGAAAAPPIRQDRVLAFLFVIGFLAMMGFVVGLGLGVEGNDIPILGLAMLTFFLACVPLAVDQGRLPQYRHVFMSLLAVIFIVYYVIPALVIFIPAELPIDAAGLGTSALTDPDIAVGQLVVLVGLVTLLVTYWLPLGRRIGSRLPRPEYDWPPRIGLIVGVLMMGMGWSVMAAGMIGLIPKELGSGVIGTLAVAETYANVLFTYLAIRYRMRVAIALIVINCVVGGTAGLVTSGKERALIGPAMVVLTWILMSRKIRARWVLAGLAAVIVIYPASEFLRYGAAQQVGTAGLLSNPVATLRLLGNFVSGADTGNYLLSGMAATAARTDGLGVTSVLVRDTPELSPFQYGRTVSLFFVAFIPRVLWPGKPQINLGKWIAHTYGSGRDIEEVSYIAPTQLGEWYINFGVAGVMLGMFLIGLIVRVTQESLLQGRGTAPSMLAASVLLYLLTRRFQGSVAGTYSEIVFTLAPIVMTHVAFRFLGAVVRVPAEPAPARRPLLAQAQAPADSRLTAPS